MFTELARTRVAMAEAEKATARLLSIEEFIRGSRLRSLSRRLPGDAKIERWLDSVKEEL